MDSNMTFVRLAFAANHERRVQHFEAHKAYLHAARDIIVMSGPLAVTDGDRRVGSLVVLDASLEQAEAFNANDPFVIHGVYEDVRLLRYDKSIG
jgi:uncharacterized protein YciI